MNVFTMIVAPIGIGVITAIMAVAVSARTGVGEPFAIALAAVSGFGIAIALIVWSFRIRN